MKLIKNFFISIMWFLTMCYLLFSPSSGLPKGDFINIPYMDKIVHWGMFSIMTLIFLYENEKSKYNIFKASVIVFLWSLLFGSLSEYIQFAYVAERKGSFFDFIADITGTLMAFSAYFLIIRKYILKK